MCYIHGFQGNQTISSQQWLSVWLFLLLHFHCIPPSGGYNCIHLQSLLPCVGGPHGATAIKRSLSQRASRLSDDSLRSFALCRFKTSGGVLGLFVHPVCSALVVSLLDMNLRKRASFFSCVIACRCFDCQCCHLFVL